MLTPARSSERRIAFRFSSGSPWKYSMCWMPASGYLRLGGIVVGSRCTGRMCPLRSLASTTSLATLCEWTADSVTISSRTLAPSSALTISSPHSVAPSMPPWSIQSDDAGRAQLRGQLEDAVLVLARVADEYVCLRSH